MDQLSFDRLARLLGATGSRRAALGTVLGSVLGGTARETAATGNAHRGKGKQRRGPGRVSAQASCGSPGAGQNLDGCDFSGQDLSGVDWHGSSLRGTDFSGATMTGANLSSSNARGHVC